jgi:DNA-directed RNA polymerase subunit RPC12/RpoP
MRADVICLNCGRDLGEVQGESGRLRLLRPGAGGITPVVRGRRLACGRCGGRALVEPLGPAA